MGTWRAALLLSATILVAGACSSRPSGGVVNTPPSAVLLAAPLEGPPPLLVDFSGVLSSDVGGEVVGFDWDLGDGTTSAADELSHTYTVEGIYDVVLTVTDNKGGTDTETVQVVVNTTPTVTAGSDLATGSTPLAVNFTSVASDPGGTIVATDWDFGDGGTSTEANPSHTYLAAGTYDATVTVTDDLGGTASDSVSVTVTGNQGPTAAAGADVTFGKAPLAVTFNSTGSNDADDGIAGFDWDFGDGNVATGAAPPAHTYTAAGTYTATLTVTDVLGATDTATVVVTVVENVAPTAGFLVGTVPPKTGLPVDFDATGSTDPDGTIVSYSWNFGDASTGSGPTPSHTYAVPASYPVELTVTDDNGATDTITLVVAVADNVAPTAAASVTTPQPKTGFAVDFDATGSTDSDGSVVSYSWDFGDTGTATGATPSHTYATAGTYNVTLTVTDDNGATDDVIVIVDVADNLAPTASFTAGPITGPAPLSVAFDGTASTDADGTVVSYSWDFGDATSSTAVAPNHTYTAAGSYTAVLTVTDDNGATGTDSVVITVDP